MSIEKLPGETKVMCVKNISLGGITYESGKMYRVKFLGNNGGVYILTPDKFWDHRLLDAFEQETFNEHFKTLEEIRNDKINSLI